MTKPLDIGLITVNRKVQAGSVVLWDSDNLTLNASANLSELTRDIVLKESLISSSYSLANERASLLAVEIARNQSNTAALNECDVRINNVAKAFSNQEVRITQHVKVYHTYDLKELVPKEAEAQRLLQMLNEYIVDLEVLRLNSFILITNLNDAWNTVENLETATFSYRDKVNDLYNDLLDLENRVNLCLYQLAVLKTKLDPALLDMYKMRVMAYDLLSKYRLLWQRLLRLEIAIAENFKKLCEAEGLLSLLRAKVTALLDLLAKVEDRMEKCLARLVALNTILSEIRVTQELATEVAYEIAVCIEQMTGFINDGLLKPGENIQIEYTPSGHAIVHAHLPEYEPREVFHQQCFDRTPREFSYDAPKCPPVIPACPTSGGGGTSAFIASATTLAPVTSLELPSVDGVREVGDSDANLKYAVSPWAGCVAINYLNVTDAIEVRVAGWAVAVGKGSGTLEFKYQGFGTLEVLVVGKNPWEFSIKCSNCGERIWNS